MKKIYIITVAIVLSCCFINAKDRLYVYKNGRVAFTTDVTNIDSITFKYKTIATKPFIQDSAFAKIYGTLGMTGSEQPGGSLDITGMNEAETSFIRELWEINELPTDEAICAWNDAGVPDLNFDNWKTSNKQLRGFYARLMFDINLCNQFLNQTGKMIDSKSVKQIAEVKFLRALNYYYLLDMFGNVPLVTTLSFDLPVQTSRSNLYDWIVNELLSAEPNMYEPRQAPYYRADKAAAWMLLSRLYLNALVYTGTEQYINAATYAKKVLDSSYKLNPGYAQLFMADNAGTVDGSNTNTAPQEIILPISCDASKTKNYYNSMFLIASTRSSDMPGFGSVYWSGNRARASLITKFFPSGIPTNANLNNLTTAAGDDRAMFYGTNRSLTITDVSKFTDGFSVTKFTNLRSDGKAASYSVSGFTDTDVPLFRIAEAYLTYAEAIIMSNGDKNIALTYINALRSRSNAPALTTVDNSVLIDEWSREFYFEGRRRTDLIRFGAFSWGGYKWDWQGGSATGQQFGAYNNLFPIPQAEIDNNPNLNQNPGY